MQPTIETARVHLDAPQLAISKAAHDLLMQAIATDRVVTAPFSEPMFTELLVAAYDCEVVTHGATYDKAVELWTCGQAGSRWCVRLIITPVA